MISQMDQIYANASITIIAASDGDTEMGLCGVSKPRQLQRHVDVQDVALMELPLVHEALKSSKWASRGWTYQEGYLSTKRLIFTTTQSLFLCNGSYGSECLQQLLGIPCCSDDPVKFKNLIPDFTTTSRRLSVKYLLNHIREYSTRELTRSDDSLNAFLGVFSYYAKNSANMTSPVVQLPWGMIANKHKKETCFRLHFFWRHNNPATRRTNLPSWSWAGWGGPLRFDGPEIVLQPENMVERDSFSYLDWELSMRGEDGKVMTMYDLSLKEFQARKDKHRLYHPGPKQLQISCLVIPVSFQDLKLSEDQRKGQIEMSIHDTGECFAGGRDFSNGIYPIFQVWKGIFVGKDDRYLSMDRQVGHQDCILGLIHAERGERCCTFRLLLVRQMSEGLYERAGLLSIGNPALVPRFTNSEQVFLDGTGSVLDKFSISDSQRKHPFADTARKRTIILV